MVRATGSEGRVTPAGTAAPAHARPGRLAHGSCCESTLGRISRLATKPRSLGDVLQEFSQHRRLMQEELQKVIIGQSDVTYDTWGSPSSKGGMFLQINPQRYPSSVNTGPPLMPPS